MSEHEQEYEIIFGGIVADIPKEKAKLRARARRCGLQCNLVSGEPLEWAFYGPLSNIRRFVTRMIDDKDEVESHMRRATPMKTMSVKQKPSASKGGLYVKNLSVSAEDILAFLNGRLVSSLVLHDGMKSVAWRLTDAQRDGLTIEDAIVFWATERGIDIAKEASGK